MIGNKLRPDGVTLSSNVKLASYFSEVRVASACWYSEMNWPNVPFLKIVQSDCYRAEICDEY